ncbi:MAG: KH domain-containing protein [Bacillota bacterium]
MIQELVKFMVTEFVGHENFGIETVTGEAGEKTIVLRLDSSDMGKVIGKQGRIAKAMRTIVKAAASKEEGRFYVEIKEIGEE